MAIECDLCSCTTSQRGSPIIFLCKLTQCEIYTHKYTPTKRTNALHLRCKFYQNTRSNNLLLILCIYVYLTSVTINFMIRYILYDTNE